MFILFCLYAALRALHFDFVAKPFWSAFASCKKRFELIEAPLSKKKKPCKNSQKVATFQSKDAACPPFQRQVSRGDPVISFVPKYFYTPPSPARVDPSIRSLAHSLLGSAVICIHNLSPIAPTLSRHDAA